MLNQLKTEYRKHAAGSDTQIPLSAMMWNLFYGKYDFSYSDLYWLIDTLKKEDENSNKQLLDPNYLC